MSIEIPKFTVPEGASKEEKEKLTRVKSNTHSKHHSIQTTKKLKIPKESEKYDPYEIPDDNDESFEAHAIREMIQERDKSSPAT